MKNFTSSMRTRLSIMSILLCIATSSCEKFLSIAPPSDQISAEQVFNNDDSARASITGVYSRMVSGGFASGDIGGITALTGMSSDELICYNLDYDGYYRNSILSTSIANPWVNIYSIIYSVNAILEGLESNNGVTLELKQQLIGEAKFIRAFCYFYLTNLYGEVPLNLTSDYRINRIAFKSKESEIYNQIIKDLKDAQVLLSDSYISTERVRVNKWVATAFLSRVYLYIKKNAEAEASATLLINNVAMYQLQTDLNKVFLKNSEEAIFQLYPNTPGINAKEGSLFILTTTPSKVSLSQDLFDSFQDGDLRKSNWVNSITVASKIFHYPYKYKVSNVSNLSEYSMVLRLGEQYLIRAEARINQDKISLGIEDLNILRKRARAVPTSAVPNPLPALMSDLNKSDALVAVEEERRSELFCEWGERWFNLKRTNRADIVLKSLKGSAWQKTDVLYPVPQDEINGNPNIIQNNGY